LGDVEEESDSDASSAGSLVSLGDPVYKARKEALRKKKLEEAANEAEGDEGFRGSHSHARRASAVIPRQGHLLGLSLDQGHPFSSGPSKSKRRHSLASASSAAEIAAFEKELDEETAKATSVARVGFNDEDDEEQRRLTKAGLSAPYVGLAGMHMNEDASVVVRGGASLALLNAKAAKEAASGVTKHIFLEGRFRSRRGSSPKKSSSKSKRSKLKKGSDASSK